MAQHCAQQQSRPAGRAFPSRSDMKQREQGFRRVHLAHAAPLAPAEGEATTEGTGNITQP